ncbi:MAG: M28 family peptidase [Planctomycetota bacterium]|nr:M28 family peptidase [Planctomycetota bacterium]
MHRRAALILLCAPLLLLVGALPAADVAAAPADATVHHDLRVQIAPGEHRLEVEDALTFPGGLKSVPRGKDGGLIFELHAGLAVEALEGSDFDVRGVPQPDSAGLPPRSRWQLVPRGDSVPATPTARLRYAGTLHHEVTQVSEEYARSFSQTPGTIEAGGVFLGGSTWWVPRFGEELVTFRLQVSLPDGWSAVSQGVRAEHEGTTAWVCEHPMDEIYLIANQFQLYRRTTGGVDAQVWLRAKDDTLAAQYLEVTAQYIEMYRGLLGPYPYRKFALVENFWETGYGMPSFTLLGPRVIRFPFILHSSYPHEILHNWWGNSVYVDWASGNWCEGLTAYLADHLVREGQGRGEEYRQDALKSYRDYVNEGKDFALTEFRSRHSAATQAVGYGKCLMVFHMLRRMVGEERFASALQQFYRSNMWRRASWADVRVAFEAVAKRDLGAWFAQWVERVGAPALEIASTRVDPPPAGSPGGSTLVLTLRQTQSEAPYALDVPLAITLAGADDVHVETVAMTEREQQFRVHVAGRAVRVDVDPQFDLFRRLDRKEIPATIGQVFGAPKTLLLVPLPDDDPLSSEWMAFAKGWATRGDVEVAPADAHLKLPKDRSVWILGTGNSWRKAFDAALTAAGAGVGSDTIDFGTTELPRADHSFVFTGTHPGNAELAIGWIGASDAAALPGLARKLPHYGKYGWLGFQGAEPTNVAKGRFDAPGSPLATTLVEEPTTRGGLPVREPLARLAPVFDPERLMTHVRWLAADAREGRGVGTAGLEASAEYIAKAFEAAGLQPGGDDGTWFQWFEAPDGPDGKTVRLRNVIGVLPGTDPALTGQSAVVGAHYDHLGRGWPDVRAGSEGQIHNGADDNASGVAVVLELAGLLGPSLKPARSIVFAAFSGEEWGLKGSAHYTRAAALPAKQAIGMLNLDSVGRLGSKKLTLFGASSATEWRHIAMGVGFTTGVESDCVAEDPGGGDHVSFHRIGVPAVHVFTGVHADFHRPTDDADRVDADGLVKVAVFAREALVYLASREPPLTSTLAESTERPAPPVEGRRVSLGTMPDFSHPGPGVKVQGITPGSPAESAGILAGDILLALDDKPLADLRGFAELLRAYAPGDTVTIRLRRGDAEQTVKAALTAR